MTADDTAREGGLLSVVSTPIGNLEDVTLRCLRTLAGADVILAEDTRRTRKLCTHHGIDTPLKSFHAHSGSKAVERAIATLGGGQHVAVVTDAGTPLVSDPGADLVAAARDAGIRVEVIPGPSAVTAAVAIAGVPFDAFCFVGFLPRSGRQRRDALDAIAQRSPATVLFESPHRVADTLTQLAKVLGDDRMVAVCRELTKVHESVLRGSASALAEQLAEGTRGELTLVIEGQRDQRPALDPEALDAAISEGLAGNVSPRDLARQLADSLGLPKRVVYSRIQQLIASED